MAAEVLSAELGLDLYRIDLSQVVSKYIGETEKNLRRIFDAADEGGVILLFDEADALFGKRSEVSDSHDRYANIEVAYLLQKMEGYAGAVILATNFRRNIDDAFVRRLDFVIDFPFPEAEDRKRIWRLLLPEEAPLAGDPPNPINPPPGCRFHTRCAFAEAVCAAKEPALYDAGPEHEAACLMVPPNSGHSRAPGARDSSPEGKVASEATPGGGRAAIVRDDGSHPLALRARTLPSGEGFR